ncbi:hypothetical protein PQO03_17810 [Lentisphaera profundi]|uniref:beta-mannosidase n=1 Tax=Lentisphaera profundi TaxID=1658616 RepID=A0ABY7VV95_9BACT|nr:glycoside hydrolase family 2 protein [Lentisphaera profundi]WDE97684.1 hypothetical protein PQO03_17810 [Lentisphaera profundi]
MKTLDLNNEWILQGFSPDKSKKLDLTAQVPGHVHLDLSTHGHLPDMFWKKNADQCQWPEFWEWSYKKTFDLPQDYEAENMYLQFDGLDTFANIYLNGKKFGTPDDFSSENMFLPCEFDISQHWLKLQGNVLEVHFTSIHNAVSLANKLKPLPGAFADPLRPYVRRMQCTFGWDWVHRFIGAGIWKPCRIISFPKARIENSYVFTSSLNDKKAVLNIENNVECKDLSGLYYRLEIYSPNKDMIYKKSDSLISHKLINEVEIKAPEMWWPKGYGKASLYDVKFQILDSNGKSLDTKITETGIRTIEIEEIDDAQRPGSSFTIKINNVRIFAKGANWVPAHPFPSRISKEKYTRLIEQAEAANFNTLRVWGGGIYESDDFWKLCNRKGIMVLQDFMLACQSYPENDPQFTSLLKREFTANIIRIRNHASLIFWYGDNELGLGSQPQENWNCKELHQTLTKALLEKLDPSRPFRISSPHGKDPRSNNSLISGDCHKSSFEESFTSDYRKVMDSYNCGRFVSEHAVAGLPPKNSILKFMNEDDFRTGEILEYHTKDNPYIESGLTLYRRVEHHAETLYGSDSCPDIKLKKMEYFQYEDIRLAMESVRRRKFYSSGILFWMFNDCWPASGWSLVDYWGNRKAAWYAAQKGSAAIILASEADDQYLKWHLCSDLMQEKNVSCLFKIISTQGELRWSKELYCLANANISQQIFQIELEELKPLLADDAVFVAELFYDESSDRSYWTAGLPQEVQYAACNLSISESRNRNTGSITISTDNWAHVVSLQGDLDFSDNYFELLPGESKTIHWSSPQELYNDPMTIHCWNLKEIIAHNNTVSAQINLQKSNSERLVLK